jgi:hypothetical protein
MTGLRRLLSRRRPTGEPRQWMTARRRATLCAAAIAVGATGSAVAWAYWGADIQVSGYGSAQAATVNQGATPTATADGQTVTVTWGASTLSNGVEVDGYVIKRYNTSDVQQTILTSCTGTIAALSCVETGVPAGQWKYSVTPKLANWLGTESVKSGTVTVSVTTSLTLAKTIFKAPEATTGSLTGFVNSEGIAYRMDAATALTGAPAATTANGTATITSLSIPETYKGSN